MIKNWAGSPKLVAKRSSCFFQEGQGQPGSQMTDDQFNQTSGSGFSLNQQNGNNRQEQQFIIRKNTGSFNKGSPRLQALSISKVHQSPKSTLLGKDQHVP